MSVSMVTLSMEIDASSSVPNMKITLEIIVYASQTIIMQLVKNALHAHTTQDLMLKELCASAMKDLSAMTMEDVLRKNYYPNVLMEWIDYPMESVCATDILTLEDVDQLQNAQSKQNGIKIN